MNMFRFNKQMIPVAVVILFSACNSGNKITDEEEGLAAIRVDSLVKHIEVLASDDFQGRKPFTEGETKTIAYLQQQFANAGLEPGNGNSYLQEVPMVNLSYKPDTVMQVESPKGNFTLKGFDDYVVWTDRSDSVVSFRNDELVFAGYGVVAPEYGWDDYKGLDVKGKIVLVKVNDPGFETGDTTMFKGKAMTYYGRWPYKYEEAAKHGAKGCLIIHNTKAASYPFSVVQNSWNNAKLHLDDRGKGKTYCDIIGWVSSDAAKKLLEAGGRDTTVLPEADKRGFAAIPLGVKLSTSVKVTATYNKSHNVIGKITGSKHPEETIIYTGHWDHLGIGKPNDKGDSIYNGALDNASGTAGLLEIARAFKSLREKPERTIVILAVTAEEQGLWGSAYYAQNPVYPIDKTIANINMDVLNWFGKTNDMTVVGQGQSDIEDILKEEAAKRGRYISFEQHPEGGSYYRSDHFNFAKVGVPALESSYGADVVGKGKEYGEKKKEEYTTDNYHRPSDQLGPAITFDGAVEDLKLLFLVGKRIAFMQKTPKWKDGSEFKAVREGKK